MTKLQSILTGLVATLAVLVALLAAKQLPEVTLGGTGPGLPANLATSSTWVVGSGEDEVVAFVGERNGFVVPCASRVITTKAEPILINFAGTSSSTATTTLDSLWGHLQGASTTVNYDSEVYGCGWWGVKGAGASTGTITTTEFTR